MRRVERTAARLLKTLPKLDERRRRLYRAQFSDAQCDAWGVRTTARTVLGEAERLVGAAARVLKTAAVPGYPLHRLAWLCECVVALEHAITEDDLPGKRQVRGQARAGAGEVAVMRRRLVSALRRLAPADERFQKQVTSLSATGSSPQAQLRALEWLVTFAREQRRTDDDRLLADDCGLTEALLAQAEAIRAAVEPKVFESFASRATNDSAATGRIEGRVLRELAYLHDAFAAARDEGLAVPALLLPRTVRAASRRR